jgi:hypothetical protein
MKCGKWGRLQVLSEYVEALTAGMVPNGLESLAEIHTHR